jgi:cephalosporin-C deacetylase-like acetyl esterase
MGKDTGAKLEMNYLKAVFWDYPDLTDEKYLLSTIQNSNADIKQWILTRFLEYARVIDTFKYFDVNEISTKLKDLKLRPFYRKKWERLIEVYGEQNCLNIY